MAFLRICAVVALTILSAVDLSACGSSETENAAGNGTDVAFIEAMTPHHQLAIDMARDAQRRATHTQVKKLAGEIISTQQAEIVQFRLIKDDLHGITKSDLGLPAHLTGMHMDSASLRRAGPFDRAFIDAMVPHHQGAIRMARAELSKGKSAALHKIAEGIVATQSREIRDMNEWRTSWYGKPSPAGGVPSVSGSHGAGHSM